MENHPGRGQVRVLTKYSLNLGFTFFCLLADFSNGIFVTAVCGLIGNYLVLRKISLVRCY